MKQTIRNNIFETNSSSVHSIVIKKEFNSLDPLFDFDKLKKDRLEYPINEYWNIKIFREGFLKTNEPEEILSYLYTISLICHYRPLESNLKNTFKNCIFEKPKWELDEEEVYVDDPSIYNFLPLADIPYNTYFSKEDLEKINNNFLDIIFNGAVGVLRDEDLLADVNYSDKYEPLVVE